MSAELSCEVCEGPADGERFVCGDCGRACCFVCAGDVHEGGACTGCDNDEIEEVA